MAAGQPAGDAAAGQPACGIATGQPVGGAATGQWAGADGPSGRTWIRSPLDLPSLLLVAAAVLSLALGTLGGSPPVGLFEVTGWRMLLAPLVLFSAILQARLPRPRWSSLAPRSGERAGERGERDDARRLALLALAVWAVASFAPSLLAWVQHFTGLDALHALGLRREPVRAVVPVYPDRFAAVGFFRWYQRLAHSLMPPLCLAAALAVAGRDRLLRPRLRALYLAAAALAGVAVVLTLSRAAWANLLVAVALVGLARPRAWKLALPAALLCALALAAMPAVRVRLAYMREAGGTSDRVMIWKVCGAVMADHRLTGVGWGNYPKRSLPYYARFPNKTEMRAWCHDTFLSALAEGGPLLLAAMIAYWALLLRAFWRWLRRAPDALARGARRGRAGGPRDGARWPPCCTTSSIPARPCTGSASRWRWRRCWPELTAPGRAPAGGRRRDLPRPGRAGDATAAGRGPASAPRTRPR